VMPVTSSSNSEASASFAASPGEFRPYVPGNASATLAALGLDVDSDEDTSTLDDSVSSPRQLSHRSSPRQPLGRRISPRIWAGSPRQPVEAAQINPLPLASLALGSSLAAVQGSFNTSTLSSTTEEDSRSRQNQLSRRSQLSRHSNAAGAALIAGRGAKEELSTSQLSAGLQGQDGDTIWPQRNAQQEPRPKEEELEKADDEEPRPKEEADDEDQEEAEERPVEQRQKRKGDEKHIGTWGKSVEEAEAGRSVEVEEGGRQSLEDGEAGRRLEDEEGELREKAAWKAQDMQQESESLKQVHQPDYASTSPSKQAAEKLPVHVDPALDPFSNSFRSEDFSELGDVSISKESGSPWLDDSILNLLCDEIAPAPSSNVGVDKTTLAQHVWELCREHESLLRLAEEQASLSQLPLCRALRTWQRRVQALRKQLPGDEVGSSSALPLSEALARCEDEVMGQERRLRQLAEELKTSKVPQRVSPKNRPSHVTAEDQQRGPAENSVAARLLMERAGLQRRIAALETKLVSSHEAAHHESPGTSRDSFRDELSGLQARCLAAAARSRNRNSA